MSNLRSVDDILKHSKSHALRMILKSWNGNEIESTQVHPENTQWKISQILLTYCDPKPEFDGLTAWELAGKIMEVMK